MPLGAVDLVTRCPRAFAVDAEDRWDEEDAALALRAWERARLADRDAARDWRDVTDCATLSAEECVFNLDPRGWEAPASRLRSCARLRLSESDAATEERDATDDATLADDEYFFRVFVARYFDPKEVEAGGGDRGRDQTEASLPRWERVRRDGTGPTLVCWRSDLSLRLDFTEASPPF